jgi:hypothetical protein
MPLLSSFLDRTPPGEKMKIINTNIHNIPFTLNPLNAGDVYIRQILYFPNRLQSMSFIFVVVLKTQKR